VTTHDDRFRTAVHGVSGVWPAPPTVWSYSSLRDAEECPRRWMLSRASYPSIWQRTGYPPRPILPALVGDAVHEVLEMILRALHAHGCESLADPCAVDVLKELGGYSKLVERAIDEQLARLEDNPRIADRLPGLRTLLRMRVPDIRHRVQAVIARTTVKPTPLLGLGNASRPQRGPLSDGSYPEVELRVPELRFTGRADLLTVDGAACVITDYKTGVPDSHHADQVRTYALLWSRDVELNPNKLPVQLLVLAYATHDEQIDPPTDSELGALARQIAARTVEADRQLQLRPPPAYPSPDMCRLCAVRHLCEDYWAGPPANAMPPVSSDTVNFVDIEAVVVSQNGPRSWIIEIDPDRASALLRTPTEAATFRIGDRLRLLDLAHGHDDDADRAILTVTQSSEVFVLERQH
jgi:PD-(D/E)XK nuclease superfamily